jgi:hypothetical protein
MEEVVAHLFSQILYSFHPSEADYLVSEQFSFYGVRLLFSRPNSNLEDGTVPLCLAPTPWPVRHGWPYQQLRYRSHSSQGLGLLVINSF